MKQLIIPWKDLFKKNKNIYIKKQIRRQMNWYVNNKDVQSSDGMLEAFKIILVFMIFSYLKQCLSIESNNMRKKIQKLHCMKSVQIRRFFLYVFSLIRTECVEILVSLRIQSQSRKIQTRKNSVFWHFSRSAWYRILFHCKTTNIAEENVAKWK